MRRHQREQTCAQKNREHHPQRLAQFFGRDLADIRFDVECAEGRTLSAQRADNYDLIAGEVEVNPPRQGNELVRAFLDILCQQPVLGRVNCRRDDIRPPRE